ncbi:metallophosphoesterase [Pluralibacter gergoviae]|uniref:metallophosphoesterase n=1 Tax=Pluralibacter gergoviae TaxID=61647 RepID=UPI00069DA8E7|nr:metallophosphoesterase [Pluralibacter gergoviae]
MHNRPLVFIGDIHGQHRKLARLLTVLKARVPEASYLFIGDLIDNKASPDLSQLAVLEQVKALVDEGRARCLMGNHELNAIGWTLRDPESGAALRPHTANNAKQHGAFLAEVGEGSAEHLKWVAWFRTLPLFADFGDVRAVHACWDARAIAALRPYLTQDNVLQSSYWPQAFDPTSVPGGALETLLKGPELRLPDGFSFTDKTGHRRRHIRVRWWRDDAVSYQRTRMCRPPPKRVFPIFPSRQNFAFPRRRGRWLSATTRCTERRSGWRKTSSASTITPPKATSR